MTGRRGKKSAEEEMQLSDRSWFDRLFGSRMRAIARQAVAEHEARRAHAEPEEVLTRPLIHGDRSRLKVAPTATVNNALFNLSSGTITVGEHSFFGHNVSVLTGSHDTSKFGPERKTAIPKEGRDVVIGEGVWLSSNVTVIGPCTIGDHAVVGACSLVQKDVEAYSVVAGVPAKEIKRLDPSPSSDDGDDEGPSEGGGDEG
ncbi:MAG: acyltransferase [Actinomycetota bacterium]|nr:acyltransferase [Actinomycetota bacterium]